MGSILKEEVIKRPEFEFYVKMTAEAIQTIAKSSKESAKESRESNQILREYIITNNQKHDDTSKRITNIAKEMHIIKEAVDASSKVTSFWSTVHKYTKYIIIGGLTALGAITANYYWSK